MTDNVFNDDVLWYFARCICLQAADANPSVNISFKHPGSKLSNGHQKAAMTLSFSKLALIKERHLPVAAFDMHFGNY